MCCSLYHATEDRPASVLPDKALTGTVVSSLHRLKDIENQGKYAGGISFFVAWGLSGTNPSRGLDGGFFVFGDLSVKTEGEFRLLFDLYEMRKYLFWAQSAKSLGDG